ncbi:tetratricopeptide repeat protein [Aurantimonas marianensis]|uniref:Tetratricopeptide repeat protein n=1 Tax=Aurantimonas marianensis TaxID=2920428 RepID=A0A9X2HB13_9HYPH|nr:tetratricopeptide repeat protein [Aurantimonas marianensis]MCP3054289.1 hypothetical protein [Aurantimonas marianensis]
MRLDGIRWGAMARRFAVLPALLAPPAGVATAETPQEESAGAIAVEAAPAELFAALKSATSEAEGRAAETAIWRFWMSAAPDPIARRLVDDAMKRRGDYDFAGARQLLDKAITRAPAYAEAFNQRGFIRFLQDDFDGALEDVDRAIELEPRHFAAMAGRAHILMRQGRFRLAQAQLREAVNIHPFLKERTMLVPPVGTTPAKPAGDGFDL